MSILFVAANTTTPPWFSKPGDGKITQFTISLKAALCSPLQHVQIMIRLYGCAPVAIQSGIFNNNPINDKFQAESPV